MKVEFADDKAKTLVAAAQRRGATVFGTSSSNLFFVVYDSDGQRIPDVASVDLAKCEATTRNGRTHDVRGGLIRACFRGHH